MRMLSRFTYPTSTNQYQYQILLPHKPAVRINGR
jgi:hypothetical protein